MLRWIIWYIRSCFCKHEWTIEEKHHEVEGNSPSTIRASWTSVALLCKKCGYCKEHKKHGEGANWKYFT